MRHFAPIPSRFRCTALSAALAALCAGCASPYWQNRRADAADVFTATAGIGLGATARIGPLHAGLGANADLYGIEAGEVGALGDPYHFVDGLGNWAGDSCFVFNGKTLIELGPRSAARGKDVAYRPSCIPFWDPPPPESPNPARWTQIEVAAGLLGGVRLGFNPGELLDFLLGFFGADLYGDDLARGEEEEKESHAESAENAEPFSVPNRLRLSGTDVPLGATNELAFAVEKGRLPCEFALDCQRLETGSLTVFCENGRAVFYPSNRIDVVTEGGTETIAADHPVATLSFGEGVNHEKTLVVDPEGLRRRREPNIRTALRCKVAEDEKRYLVTIPIVLSHDCPPTNVTFQLLSNWYDY